jgi:hypothetical protein
LRAVAASLTSARAVINKGANLLGNMASAWEDCIDRLDPGRPLRQDWLERSRREMLARRELIVADDAYAA